jgi:hypothetical protein
MVKFLLGMVAAAAGGKFIEAKTGSKPLEYASNVLLFFGIYNLLRRK